MWWTRKTYDDSSGDDGGEFILEELHTDDLVVRIISGQVAAFGEIWRRHYGRMRAMARSDLRAFRELRPLYEAEDALIDAAAEMTRSAMCGGLVNKISCGNDFWLFFRNVLRQCIRDERERRSALGRGGEGPKRKPAERPRRRRVFTWRRIDEDAPDTLNWIPSNEVSHELLVITEDVLDHLFSLLDDEQHQIASLRLSNLCISEIAEKTERSERTIIRRLNEIRRIWTESGLLDGC